MPERVAPSDQLELAAHGRYIDRDGDTVDIAVWADENDVFAAVEELEPSIHELSWLTPDFDDIGLAAGALRALRPAVVLWDEYQTPIRNQSNRNTCSAFCMVAAIEARYKRDHGFELDLSEQFFWHMYKSTGITHPRYYQYENQSSFWGGGNSHGLKTAVNFVICEETHAPYLNRGQMEALRDSIPGTGPLAWKSAPAENLNTQDQVDAFEYSTSYIGDSARGAARYGVNGYELLSSSDARNTGRLEGIIASGHEVLLDVNLQWKADADGVMRYDSATNRGAHCFLLVGYDRGDQYFYVKNSWGGSAYTKVGYDMIQNAARSGSYITSVRTPGQVVHGGRFVGRWNMDHDGWEGVATIRRWPEPGKGVRRLGHYVRNGRRQAINGRTISDSQTIEFSLEGAELADPGAMTGQRFTTSIFSWQVDIAAGTTRWSNIPFGVQLLRTPRPSMVRPDDNRFEPEDWIGTWAMNHDGWRGQLTIGSVGAPRFGIRPVTAAYRDHGGIVRPAKGALLGSMGHALHLNIAFSGSGSGSQRFLLYVHTFDTVRFSGTTTWAGRPFGVIGVRSS